MSHFTAYDEVGRLLSVTRDGALVEQYAYGPHGARVLEMNVHRGVVAPRALEYSDEDHLLNTGGVSYAYDLDGFLTTRSEGSDVTTYAYSLFGELKGVSLPDGRTIEYVHDPLGRRIARKIDGIITEKYLWQGQTRLLAVLNADGGIRQRFIYADGRMPFGMEQDGSTYYLAYDQVGTLKVVADSAGTIVKQLRHDSFGYEYFDSNPGFKVPFGFAGGLYDEDTGLIRFGYRDYDPEAGRWTAKDPIGFAGGDTDLYGYCLNDPVNLIDPTGEYWHIVVGDLVGGGVSAFNTYIHNPNASFKQYALSFTVGAASGASSTALGYSFLIGPAADLVSQLIEQAVDPCESVALSDVDWDTIALSALAGGASSILGVWGEHGNIFFSAGVDIMLNIKEEAIKRGYRVGLP